MSSQGSLWVGVDVGGTFTDIVVYDDSTGELSVGKRPSTPDDPSVGVLDAIGALAVDLGGASRFRHGATVATNTALERKGATLGVVTSAGFRDVLIVGRGQRQRLYDIKAVRPPGLVKRSRIMEVPERLGANGETLVPLDEDAVVAAAVRLRELGAEAVAICFLHSYENPEPERRAGALVSSATPGVFVTTSSEVLPAHREYERFSTTALNAYVAPRMAGYLDALNGALASNGLTVAPEIMSSSGGSWSFGRMGRLPVNSMLSGPAGGVIGAVSLAAALGESNVISYDMGGTSTDTCLIRNGRYALATDGDIGGFPNRAPQIEIKTVGAGGGSIAYLDAGGFLSVGPRSAGANPGPACYNQGGTEPTVTDANVVLGRFRPAFPLGGKIEIDDAASVAAISALGGELGLERMETAEGIIRIAVVRMTNAIKEISIMRGLDPRDFSLLAYGGAGPLHAALIAEELGISTVIVPPLPGGFSAYGLLVADRRHDLSRTKLLGLDGATLADVDAILGPIRESAAAELEGEGFTRDQMRFESSVDIRYEGQAFELTTPVPEGARDIDDLVDAFHRIYEERYTHVDEGPVEAVAFRVSTYGLTAKPQLPRLPPMGGATPALLATRPVVFEGRSVDTCLYRREAFAVGACVAGPAIIEEEGSTTLVPPGFNAACHATGALVVSRGEEPGGSA